MRAEEPAARRPIAIRARARRDEHRFQEVNVLRGTIDGRRPMDIPFCMPLLTVVPPMPGAERRFRPFTEFVHASGWDTEFVQLDWTGPQPNSDSRAVFEQVNAQTAGKVVMGFSLGALYSHLGALSRINAVES